MPLVVDEPTTDVLSALFTEDTDVIVSFITPIEVTAAMWRKAGVNRDLREQSEHRYAALELHWAVTAELEASLEESLRVVHRHGLRAGDAIQLACAIIAIPKRDIPFVTLDGDLRDAARAEGFPVLPLTVTP